MPPRLVQKWLPTLATTCSTLTFRLLQYASRWPVRVRFGIALAFGAVGYALAPSDLSLAGRALMAWDAYAFTSLLLVWCLLATANSAHTRSVASQESPGRLVVFVFVPIAVACSLSAVGLLLSTGMMPSLSPTIRLLHVVLSVSGVVSAWLLLHTVFTLRYAHLYYDTGSQPGGLLFPSGSEAPAYFDFAYVAFVVGMSGVTSDVSINNSILRRAVLLHGILSFGFNSAVLAVSISGVVGVL